jgi:predicted O-methyltransferase YrrM
MDSQERPGMCSPPASIPLLQMLVKLTQANKIVEVGVFTGAALTSLGQHYPFNSLCLDTCTAYLGEN